MVFLKGTGSIHKYSTNMYKEWLPKTTVDLCAFIGKEGDNLGQKTLAQAFISKVRAPIMEIFFAPGQKFPSSCPIKPVSVHYGQCYFFK